MVEAVSDSTLEALDRKYVFHPFTDAKAHEAGATGGPCIVKSAHGIRIVDAGGRSLIDAFAGLYCVNTGYGRMEIADAIYAQAKELAYFHTYAGHSNEPLIRLSERIVRMAPAGMSKVYYGLSGSDANETLVKLVWYYNNVLGRTQKKKIIARQRGYHGATIMSGSLTGLPIFHQAFDLPLQRVLHTGVPHHYWHAEPGMSEREFSRACAVALERLIVQQDPDTVAAFIGEPVLGTGGIIPPPEGYWEEIQTVLRKYDVLLIADEVICGFGRTGAPFGSFLYGMQPDLITVAKGLTSAYVPLSGAIVGERVWSVIRTGAERFGPIGHGYTYSGHALGMAAALANLDIIEREDLVSNARRMGAYLQQRLHDLFDDHPLVGEVRGVGLLAALEFVANRKLKTRLPESLKVGVRVSAACRENGVIARAMPHGEILGFAPPLIVTTGDIDEIVERTDRAVNRIADELVREGVWH